MTRNEQIIIAHLVNEFVGVGNVAAVEDSIKEAGWTVEELNDAIVSLGEGVGITLGWT